MTVRTKLSQSSSTYVADTGELKNIYNAGMNRVINKDGFIVSLSDNSRDYVSNATAENARYLTEKYILP